MDYDPILERERRQIEQILELDSEDLQIEEVEDLYESSDDDRDRDLTGAAASDDFTFNTCLASLHSYLGEVDDTHHRMTFLDGGAVLNLPLFYLEGVVLFPEATLPLRVIQPNFIAAVEKALTNTETPYTIGVVHVSREPDIRMIKFATTGTTAEIRQYRRLEDGSINVVTRGQQRFHLRRRWFDEEGAPCGEVQIIQEDLPLRTPRDACGKLGPLSNQRSHLMLTSNATPHRYGDGEGDSDVNSEESFESQLSPAEKKIHRSALGSFYEDAKSDESTSSGDGYFSCDESESQSQGLDVNESCSMGSLNTPNVKRIRDDGSGRGKRRSQGSNGLDRMRTVSGAYWPYWVYRMFDSYSLAERAADMWKQIVGSPSMDALVRKPDLLSFHIASKIPVSESTRQELLEIDGISYRLRREIQLLESCNRVRCKNCQALIAQRSDMLVMSSDGPLGAYVNPHGFVHEIMTLLKANGLALIGRPVKEYSWFPGYAWTITNCANCETQMGWLFTATNKKLKPRSFWGIRSSQVADDTN